MTTNMTDFSSVEAWHVLRSDQELLDLATSVSVDVAGALLDERADAGADNAAPAGLWQRLKAEFFSLVCEDSDAYKDVREKAEQAGQVVQTFGIPAIAAALAAKLHLEIALLTPFVALLIAACARLGTRAWCTQQAAVRAATATPLPTP